MVEKNVQRVDPTGRIEPLQGEPNGSVAKETTMGKPKAYTSGTPRSTAKQEN